MKYSQWIGIAAACLLAASCFIPWTFYPDLQKDFTGFFSENNNYGKPGKVLIALASVAVLFYILPKVWAKRWNFLVTALIVAYAIKSFILFSGCYRGICPEKKAGLWLMLVAAVVMLVMAMVPDTKIRNSKA